MSEIVLSKSNKKLINEVQQYSLIDENVDLTIEANYDPLLKNSFDEYIHITEKMNFGVKKTFNNQISKRTNDIHISGLVLNWRRDLKNSKLRAVLKRDNIENIHLYADTIIIQRHLKFPQSNVVIHARRLIIEEGGAIDISPNPFAEPYPIPDETKQIKSNPKNRTPRYSTFPGADGDSAGKIHLYIQNLKVPKGKACFILSGSDGQKGERGGLKERVKDKKVPVTWHSVLNEIVEFDPMRGDESDWWWPDTMKVELVQNKVYATNLRISNGVWTLGNVDTNKYVSLGNESAINQDNGLDAYASGTGGNGGNGGLFSSTVKVEEVNIEHNGGGCGVSEEINGSSKTGGVKLCVDYTVEHVFFLGSASITKRKVTKEIPVRNGYSAKGNDGLKGNSGHSKYDIENHNQWLHGFLLEHVMEYAKNTFLNGDRKPSAWLLAYYQKAFEKGNEFFKEDIYIRNLSNEINLLMSKVNSNLDYFGNPVGWVPALSFLTNLKILRESQSSIVELSYFAKTILSQRNMLKNAEKKFESLSNQLNQDIYSERKQLNEAIRKLDSITIVLDKLVKKIDIQLREIRDLDSEISSKVTNELKDQAIFSGAFKILSGICQSIPAGPFRLDGVSKIFDKIGDIDIHSDNPFGEGLKTTKSLAEGLNSFVKDNKDELSNSLMSPLSKKIDTVNGEITQTETYIKNYKSAMQLWDVKLKEKFPEIDELKEVLAKNNKVRTKKSYDKRNEELTFISSKDYIALLADNEEIEDAIREIKGWNAKPKQEIREKIIEIQSSKSEAKKELEKYKKQKDKRASEIGEVFSFLENASEGVSTIADGFNILSSPIDQKSQEFLKKVDDIKSDEGRPYKKKFKKLNGKVNKLNGEKQEYVENFLKFQLSISTSCQNIGNALTQITNYNDQRAQDVESQINHITKLFLSKTILNIRELLLHEIYHITKSYQYCFVERIPVNLLNTQNIFDDIYNQVSKNNTADIKAETYEEIFKNVIRGKLIDISKDILINRLQILPNIEKNYYIVSLNKSVKLENGKNLLETFNASIENNVEKNSDTHSRKITFKLHELENLPKKGTGNEYYYRIRDIVFKDIEVEIDSEYQDLLSFRFGIRHSGTSVIRAKNGKFYYFTSNSPKLADKSLPDSKYWGASYNGKNRNTKNKGIEKDRSSEIDAKVFEELIGADTKSITYTEHYPSATSDLTFLIEKNNINILFNITRIDFEFHYELLP